MGAITGQNLVNEVLVQLRVIFAGETPNASESAAVLSVINNLSDNWGIQRLMNLSMDFTSVSTTGGTFVYTPSPRPAAITSAFFTLSGGLVTPVKLLNAVEYSEIVDRDITANIVKGLYYNRDLGAPLIFITPSATGTLNYASWAASTPQWSGLSDSETLAPGYQRALVMASALEASSLYSVPAAVLTTISQAYQEAMSALRQLNAELLGPEPAALPAGSNVPAPGTSPSGSPGS